MPIVTAGNGGYRFRHLHVSHYNGTEYMVVGGGIGSLPSYNSDAEAIADGLISGQYYKAGPGHLDGLPEGTVKAVV